MEYLRKYASSGLLFERICKGLLILLAVAIVLGAVYYFIFRNWREEMQARRFFKLIEQQEYSEAYHLWGCSDEQPCRYYPFDEFLEDWGLDSPLGKVDTYSLGRSYTQPDGVILRYRINGKDGDPLWIDRESRVIGFAP